MMCGKMLVHMVENHGGLAANIHLSCFYALAFQLIILYSSYEREVYIASILDLGCIFTLAFRSLANMSPRVVYI